MGYLSAHEHDIFVSYAHSDQLNAWSKRLVERTRSLVAGGLGLREADQVGLRSFTVPHYHALRLTAVDNQRRADNP